MIRVLLMTAALMLCGCASTHHIGRDGLNVLGGGFIDDKVGPGLCLIKGFSNRSPFVTADAAAAKVKHE